MKKSSLVYLIVSLLLVLSIPISILSCGFGIPSQFDETYYGELPYMFNRLKETKKEKIIIIGNSAVAFGTRADLIKEELDKEVVLFGLYAAIGTKTMMDLSKVNISKGDIVVFVPEISSQGLSLYFSARNTWRAVDGHFEMLDYIANENRKVMIGNFTNFTAEKFDYFVNGAKPNVNGVYQQDSFDLDGEEVGYMTYDRPYNIMLDGNNGETISFDENLIQDDFIDYVNDYANYVRSRGADIYFDFTPMNKLIFEDESFEKAEAFVNKLKEKLNVRFIGDISKYILDYRWFFDNNVHMNSSGMYVYTHQLIEDLKVLFKDSSPTNIVIPQIPDIPLPDYEDGDNTYEDCFTYKNIRRGCMITGLTEKGKEQSFMVIPSMHDELPVLAFDATTFQDNKEIRELVIPTNIRSLMDNSFRGCTRLTRLILKHKNPNYLNVGTALLAGADSCYIYVLDEYYDNFANHYNWSYYKDRLTKYVKS